MGILIGILTGILVLVCLLLILIILMQKSKSEGGLGAAFGGAATEQIFGAGTTSVLTRATIWGTALFFVLTLALAIIYSHQHHQSLASKVLRAAGTNAEPSLTAPLDTNAAAAASGLLPVPTNTVETTIPPSAAEPSTALTETNPPATK